MIATRKIVCPSCKAALKIKEAIPAGKRIRCPKCTRIFPAPGLSGATPSSRMSPVRTRPTAPPREQEEDREHEIEERPARREQIKKKKKAARALPLVWVLGIAGAVLLVGAAVTLAVIRPWDTKKRLVAANGSPASEITRTQPGGRRQGREQGEPPDAGTPAPAEKAPAETLSPPSKDSAAEPMNVALGRKVFESQDCSRCHAIGESAGGGRKARGPSLAHVGADPAHTVDWLSEQIRNPRSHRPNSRMPGYEDKLSPEETRHLAEYLASLK